VRTEDTPQQALRKLIRRMSIADMAALFEVLGTRSRMTVFRRLKEIGYRTSFTHAGRWYTLADLPEFDELGLWFHRDAGFSTEGTMKETVAAHVERSLDGRTHAELQHVLRVRVHNTLLDLVREGRIGQAHFGAVHLYVSADPALAAEQLARRQELAHVLEEALRTLSTEETIEVLAEALRAASGIPDAATVAARLAARGVRIEPRLVQRAFDAYGLVPGKKTSKSTSSRRPGP
jgi:predicted metal-dependent HD superfamily phosphohydrolase